MHSSTALAAICNVHNKLTGSLTMLAARISKLSWRCATQTVQPSSAQTTGQHGVNLVHQFILSSSQNSDPQELGAGLLCVRVCEQADGPSALWFIHFCQKQY